VTMLDVDDLAFGFTGKRIGAGVSLHVGPGTTLAVLGGNGAGKTTLLRVLAGLLAAAEGTVEFEGRAVDRDHLARGCAFLGHLPGHKADLGALDNLRYALGIAASRPGIDPHRALREVGLAGHEDTHARRLSAGQNKRLALARLRVSAARLWLLDEPYANLDLDGIALVDRLLAAHVAEGGGALLTTHGAYAAPPVPIRTLELA
jgi:heme exporter protein A